MRGYISIGLSHLVCATPLWLLQETDTEAFSISSKRELWPPLHNPRPRRVYEFQCPEIKIDAAAAPVHVHIVYDGFPAATAATETNMYDQALDRGSVPTHAPCRPGVRPGAPWHLHPPPCQAHIPTQPCPSLGGSCLCLLNNTDAVHSRPHPVSQYHRCHPHGPRMSPLPIPPQYHRCSPHGLPRMTPSFPCFPDSKDAMPPPTSPG